MAKKSVPMIKEEQRTIKQLEGLRPGLFVDANAATLRLFELAAGQRGITDEERAMKLLVALDAGVPASLVLNLWKFRPSIVSFFGDYQDLVRFYANCGASLQAVNDQGRSLLDVACEGSDFVACSLLMEGVQPEPAVVDRLEQEHNWYVLGVVAELYPDVLTPQRATAWLTEMLNDGALKGFDWGDDVALALINAGADIDAIDECYLVGMQKSFPETAKAIRRHDLAKVVAKSGGRRKKSAKVLARRAH